MMRVVLMACLGLLFCCSPVLGEQSKSTPDLRPAYEWLELIDRGRYFQSWQYASDNFKQNIDAAVWDKVLTGALQPLGKLEKRELIAMSHKSQLQGMPEGSYFVMQFICDFTNKKNLTETLFLEIQPSGLKTVGYFIK